MPDALSYYRSDCLANWTVGGVFRYSGLNQDDEIANRCAAPPDVECPICQPERYALARLMRRGAPQPDLAAVRATVNTPPARQGIMTQSAARRQRIASERYRGVEMTTFATAELADSHLEANPAEGCAVFPVLVDSAGKVVGARIFTFVDQFRRGASVSLRRVWKLKNASGMSVWVKAYKRASMLAQCGLRQVFAILPARRGLDPFNRSGHSTAEGMFPDPDRLDAMGL